MPTRRAVLGAVGAGTAGVAGCLGALEGSSCPEGTLGSVTGDWPTRGRTPGHVGATDAGGFGAAPETRWCADAGERWRSVVLADGTLFATERASDGGGHYLQARDAADGSGEWRVPLPDRPIAEPAVADGGVHLTLEGDDRTRLARYAAGDGAEEWRVETPTRTDSMPAVADGTVYVVDVAGGLHAYEAASGDSRWSTAVSERIDPAALGNVPAVVDGTVYVGAAIGEGPAAVDADDGAVRWQRDLPGFHRPVTDGDLLVGGDDEAVYALDPATGDTRWTVEKSRPTNVPLVLDGDTVYCLFEGAVQAHAAADGSRRWTRSPPDLDGAGKDMVATDGTLLFATRAGIAGVDPSSGSDRWTADGESVEVDTLVVAEGAAFSFYGRRLRGFEVP